MFCDVWVRVAALECGHLIVYFSSSFLLQSRHGDPTSLAFWMANASELLHFLKQDRHICGYSLDAQDILAEAVQVAFR